MSRHINWTAYLLPFAVLVSALAPPLVRAGDSQPDTIFTWSDAFGSCNPQSGSTSGCCGGPGRRECGYVINWNKWLGPGCTDPGDNITRINSYDTDDHNVCDLPHPTTGAPAVPFDFLSSSPEGTQFTFYAASDLHYFRSGFDYVNQAYSGFDVNLFAAQHWAWPAGSGIPASDKINPPDVIVFPGDLTTGGGVDELGAFRLIWEPGDYSWGNKFPIYPGLGNHDLLNSGTGGAGSSSSAQRMWDYIKSYMSGVASDMDTNSNGNLFYDDGNGTHNYSWDDAGIHFIMLNTWAGESNQYNAPASNGLRWLKNDLAVFVGKRNKPVILFQHYDLSSLGDSQNRALFNHYTREYFQSWWRVADYNNFWNIIRDYNVIGMFAGHVHAWGMERPEHYQHAICSQVDPTSSNPDYFECSDSSGIAPTEDSHGNPKIFDIFRDGTVGNCGGSGCTGGETDFFAVRVTPDYMDTTPVAIPTLGAPSFKASLFYGKGSASCRKKINSRFVDVSSQVTVSGNGCTECGVTVANTGNFPLAGPLALEVTSPEGTDPSQNLGVVDNLTTRSFVDSCDPYFGNAYILLPGGLAPQGQAGSSAEAQINLPNGSSYGWKLVQLIPYGSSNAIIPNPAAITVRSNLTPLTVALLDQAMQSITAAVDYTTGQPSGWLNVTSASVSNGQSALTVAFSTSQLGRAPAIYRAIIHVAADNGDTADIPVSLEIGPVITPTPAAVALASSEPAPVTLSTTGSNTPYTVSADPDLSVTSSGPAPGTLKITLTPGAYLQNSGTYNRSVRLKYGNGGETLIPVTYTLHDVYLHANPAGPTMRVDEFEVNTPYHAVWLTGSAHQVTPVARIFPSTGTELEFSSWADTNGANRTIVVPAGGPVTYTAQYSTLYALNTVANPSNGGSISAAPQLSTFYPANSPVTITATSAAGYVFQDFQGALQGYNSVQLIEMSGPQTVIADFLPVNQAGVTVVETQPAGLNITVDSLTYKSPAVFYWPAKASHTVSVPTQIAAPGVQDVFASWSDGFKQSVRVITGVSHGENRFVATLNTQYQMVVNSNPADAGTVTGAGWINAGASATIRATPFNGFSFSGFTGDVNAKTSAVTLLVDKPKLLTAQFAVTQQVNVYASIGNRTPIANSSGPVLFPQQQVQMPVSLVSAGPGAAGNAYITGVDAITVMGSGQVSTDTLFPMQMGTLLPGQSALKILTMNWPSTAIRVQFLIHFTANGTYQGSTRLTVFR